MDLTNPGSSIRVDLYSESGCPNKTEVVPMWDYTLFPANDPSVTYFPARSCFQCLYRYASFSRFKETNHKASISCNDTFILQKFFDIYQDEEMTEASLFRLEKVSCFFSLDPFFILGSEESYRYSCTNDDFYDFSTPENFYEYSRFHTFWNQVCYGEPYRIVEYHNGFCECFGYTEDKQLCYIEYYDGDVRTMVWKVSEEFTCTDTILETTEYDVFRLYLNYSFGSDCVTSEFCGFSDDSVSLSCHESFEHSNDNFYDESYFMVLGHLEPFDCAYFQAHPKEWEAVKGDPESVFGFITYFHSSLCLSYYSVALTQFMNRSAIMECGEDGMIRGTIFENSILCDLEKPLDESMTVTTKDIEGDYCVFSELEQVYYTFTCTSLFCNGVVQYDDDVCSGHGECELDDDYFEQYSIRIGVCKCTDYYEGEDCDIYYYVFEFMALMIGLGTVVSFLVILSLICCFCITFCGFCGLVGCVVSVLWASILGISGITFLQRKRISKYEKLKHFNILLKEQEMDEDDSVAHLKINRSLFMIPFDEVTTLSILGEGGSNSVVFKAKWNAQIVAFKCFKTRTLMCTEDKFQEFEREVEILASLQHPSIIRFYGATLKTPRVGIIMEYASNGEILEFIQRFRENCGSGYPLFQKLRMMRQVCEAMSFLHSRSIIHRDLKSENVLIDAKEDTKLMDFGLSRIIDSDSKKLTVRIGTSVYMSPEIVTNAMYGPKCDVFSFSILFFVVVCEKSDPYEGRNHLGNVEMRVACDPSFRPNVQILKDSICEEKDEDVKWIEDMIVKCWDHDPEERYSFKEVIEEFSKGEVNIQKEFNLKTSTKSSVMEDEQTEEEEVSEEEEEERYKIEEDDEEEKEEEEKEEEVVVVEEKEEEEEKNEVFVENFSFENRSKEELVQLLECLYEG